MQPLLRLQIKLKYQAKQICYTLDGVWQSAQYDSAQLASPWARNKLNCQAKHIFYTFD